MATIPTQTHPDFIWRFYSCQKRCFQFAIASTEAEARSQLPDSPNIFSARFASPARTEINSYLSLGAN